MQELDGMIACTSRILGVGESVSGPNKKKQEFNERNLLTVENPTDFIHKGYSWATGRRMFCFYETFNKETDQSTL